MPLTIGNVLGSSGSVVPLFRKQIAGGGPITLTHPDITCYFMTIPEAAQLVIQAGAMGKRGGVFVLDMGAQVRIADLAVRMVMSLYTSPASADAGPKKPFTFNELHRGLVNFAEIAFTLGISAGT